MSEQNLEKYVFAHTISYACILDIGGARRAVLPVFKMGLTKLQDDRSFRMEAADFSLLKQNLMDKKTPTPILYEHGKSPRGGIAGGKLISLQEKEGEVFAHATLTKKAFEEVKNEEWLSCSGGFLARRDEEDNIRPVKLLEVSLTNEPAFPGLSDIQTFAVLKELPMQESKAEKSQAEVTPTPLVAAEEVKLEQTEKKAPTEPKTESVKLDTDVLVHIECPCPNCPCPGCACCAADEEDEPNEGDEGDQPDMAMSMMIEDNPSIEQLRNFNTKAREKAAKSGAAMPDGSFPIMNGKDLENALHLYGHSKDPAAAKAHIRKRAKDLGLTDKLPEDFESEQKEETVELSAEQTEKVIDMVAEAKATARFEEKVKNDKVVILMAKGESDGKIVPANRAAMEAFANHDPDAFEKVLATMKPILTTKKTVTDAVIKVDLGLLDQSPEHEATILTKAVQLKALHPELNLSDLTQLVKKHI